MILHRISQIFQATCIVAVLLWNVCMWKETSVRSPKMWIYTMRLLGLQQQWSMYSPEPSRSEGGYLIVGTLLNGKRVSLIPIGATSNWKTKEIPFSYRNHRWRKWMQNLGRRGNRKRVISYARYFVSEWNTHYVGSMSLENVKFYYLKHSIQHTGEPVKFQKHLLLKSYPL